MLLQKWIDGVRINGRFTHVILDGNEYEELKKAIVEFDKTEKQRIKGESKLAMKEAKAAKKEENPKKAGRPKKERKHAVVRKKARK